MSKYQEALDVAIAFITEATDYEVLCDEAETALGEIRNILARKED